MPDKKIAQLKRVPIFARCSDAELKSLAQNTDEIDLPAGRTLIAERKPNDTFYILLAGEAEVSLQGKPIDHLKAGDFFGEISMLDRGQATATVVTTSPAEMLVMSHAQFRDAIRAHQDIALRVIAVMADRLRRTNNSGVG